MPIIRDAGQRKKIVDLLVQAYWMEIETVMNYIASSANLEGLLAEEVKKSLVADIADEVGHAQLFAKRIKELDGQVPGSARFKSAQKALQPPKGDTQVVAVIKGVIDAEQGAVNHYRKIIKACTGADDYVTADMVTTILADEEGHLRVFEGFLKENKK